MLWNTIQRPRSRNDQEWDRLFTSSEQKILLGSELASRARSMGPIRRNSIRRNSMSSFDVRCACLLNEAGLKARMNSGPYFTAAPILPVTERRSFIIFSMAETFGPLEFFSFHLACVCVAALIKEIHAFHEGGFYSVDSSAAPWNCCHEERGFKRREVIGDFCDCGRSNMESVLIRGSAAAVGCWVLSRISFKAWWADTTTVVSSVTISLA